MSFDVTPISVASVVPTSAPVLSRAEQIRAELAEIEARERQAKFDLLAEMEQIEKDRIAGISAKITYILESTNYNARQAAIKTEQLALSDITVQLDALKRELPPARVTVQNQPAAPSAPVPGVTNAIVVPKKKDMDKKSRRKTVNGVTTVIEYYVFRDNPNKVFDYATNKVFELGDFLTNLPN